MTRHEAIAAVGPETVESVDNLNCDYSGCLLPDGDDRVEFIATLRLPEASEYETLTAVYYQPKDAVAAATELDQLDWEVAAYRLQSAFVRVALRFKVFATEPNLISGDRTP